MEGRARFAISPERSVGPVCCGGHGPRDDGWYLSLARPERGTSCQGQGLLRATQERRLPGGGAASSPVRDGESAARDVDDRGRTWRTEVPPVGAAACAPLGHRLPGVGFPVIAPCSWFRPGTVSVVVRAALHRASTLARRARLPTRPGAGIVLDVTAHPRADRSRSCRIAAGSLPWPTRVAWFPVAASDLAGRQATYRFRVLPRGCSVPRGGCQAVVWAPGVTDSRGSPS
jgi:hypothetical protein